MTYREYWRQFNRFLANSYPEVEQIMRKFTERDFATDDTYEAAVSERLSVNEARLLIESIEAFREQYGNPPVRPN